MPWLEKDEVLFIHVPRCGGTSITKHHKVSQKAIAGKNIFAQLGITYYYYRYRLLETANFPFTSYENAFALCEALLAAFVFIFFPSYIPVPYYMWFGAAMLFLNSSFVWTAPILMRLDVLRNFLMLIFGRVLCGNFADVGYLIGTNEKGYLFHLTAERALRYEYVTEADMKEKSFSIVRNPYSRAVSLYEYNKRACESFDHFIRDFHSQAMERYYEKGLTDSKDVYCHVLPMCAYTHWKGSQLVKTIIKQENLKHLVTTKWEGSKVPQTVREALTGIPHANGRKKKMHWSEYYSQETMDLVLEMYDEDFEVFQYDREIPGRKELVPKSIVRKRVAAQEAAEKDFVVAIEMPPIDAGEGASDHEQYYYPATECDSEKDRFNQVELV